MTTNLKQGILNLKTVHLAKLGKIICPDAEYLRCAVPRKRKQSLIDALYAPQKLMTADEMCSQDYMISLQQLKTDEFETLTGLIFLDDYVCKIEIPKRKLYCCNGFSAFQHRHNYNEAQLVINKNNFKQFLAFCKKISYQQVSEMVNPPAATEQKAA